MPSSVTHGYFSEDVYKRLSPEVQNIIRDNLDYYTFFSQGTDPFMFYRMVVLAGNSNNIQREMHEHKTQQFFIEVVKYIHENNLTNDGMAMAFLFGYICHYHLDIHCHPFIEAQKMRQQSNRKSFHAILEYAIDEEFIKRRENVKPSGFKVYKKFFKVKEFPVELKKMINETTSNVYDFGNDIKESDLATHYEACANYMRIFWRLANMDRTGIKLVCYKGLDKLLHNKLFNSSIHTVAELSFYNKYSDEFMNDNLNMEHNCWAYPDDKSIMYDYSFWDLYDISVMSASEDIEQVSSLLKNEQLDIKALEQIFTNLSYGNGLPCRDSSIEENKIKEKTLVPSYNERKV